MSDKIQVTHIGYSDESNWNSGRIRSLGLVSMPLTEASILQKQLALILQESGISEFKWKKLGGARERLAAIKMCKFAVQQASTGKLRIDVLLWDIEDQRHKVKHRDDVANLARMYYHLFRNVLRVRWPDDAVWRLYPDEHSEIDWETMKDCLDNVSLGTIVEPNLLTRGLLKLRFKQDFQIVEIAQVDSKHHPMLQLVDLFAGLAVFSYIAYDKYEAWSNNRSPQLPLLQLEESSSAARASKRDQERFLVLEKLNSLCKRKKLGVSLKTNKGLQTFNPQNPINFWFYRPQHPDDRAPQKGGK